MTSIRTMLGGCAAALLLVPGAPSGEMKASDDTELSAGHQGARRPLTAAPLPVAADYATLRGKFIDENDFWPDGKVPGATITAYSVADNTPLASTSTDQNGMYTLAGPFFGLTVRVVAEPPTHANCPAGTQTAIVVVDSLIKRHDFKDECKF